MTVADCLSTSGDLACTLNDSRFDKVKVIDHKFSEIEIFFLSRDVLSGSCDQLLFSVAEQNHDVSFARDYWVGTPCHIWHTTSTETAEEDSSANCAGDSESPPPPPHIYTHP